MFLDLRGGGVECGDTGFDPRQYRIRIIGPGGNLV